MTAGVSSAGSCTISFSTDSIITPPKSQLPKETSQDGALVLSARWIDGLVSFSRTRAGKPSMRINLETRSACASAIPMASPAPMELPTNVALRICSASMKPTKLSTACSGRYSMSGLSDSPEPIKSGVIRRACGESGVCWCSHCHIEPPTPWIRMTGWPWPTSSYAIVWPFAETVLIGMRSEASNWGGIGGGEEHAMLATKKPNVISDIEGRLDNRVEERWRLSLFQLDNCLI